MTEKQTRRVHPAAQARFDELLAAMAARPRPVRIAKKSSHWFHRFAAKALYVLTFGGQKTYLSHYVTTLGHTIWVTEDFDEWHPDRAVILLRHELVHVEQFERWGVLGMILIYGFFPLPAFLAYGRARLEWEAYRETLRAIAEIRGLRSARRRRRHVLMIHRFTGPDYGWMWPFPRMVQRWIDEALAEIEQDLAAR